MTLANLKGKFVHVHFGYNLYVVAEVMEESDDWFQGHDKWASNNKTEIDYREDKTSILQVFEEATFPEIVKNHPHIFV